MHYLRVLSADDDIAHGWKSDNMHCLLAKAKVTEIQAQCEAECMPNICSHFRCMQIGAEERCKEQCKNLTNQKVQLEGK